MNVSQINVNKKKLNISERENKMPSNKLLLSAVFGPYGVKDEYAENLGMQMELLNNQITREQGVHSPRQSYWSFGLYLLAENHVCMN